MIKQDTNTSNIFFSSKSSLSTDQSSENQNMHTVFACYLCCYELWSLGRGTKILKNLKESFLPVIAKLMGGLAFYTAANIILCRSTGVVVRIVKLRCKIVWLSMWLGRWHQKCRIFMISWWKTVTWNAEK